jgi:phenylalanyl-tRNA synthetase beta chain
VYGRLGRVPDEICGAFGVKSPVFHAELDITEFLEADTPRPVYRPLPRYPAVERDFCFVMPEDLPAGAVSSEIAGLSDLVEAVGPFDVYRGEKLGPDLKSVAYSVRFRSSERTLSEKEAEDLSKTIISSIQSKFGATLRR